MSEQEKYTDEREVKITFQVKWKEKISHPELREKKINKAVREFLTHVEKPREYGEDDPGTPNNFEASNGAVVSWNSEIFIPSKDDD